MPVKDRIPLRDHAVQVTPGYAAQVVQKLELLLNGAGLSTPPGERIDARQLLPVLKPLLIEFKDQVDQANPQLMQLDREVFDCETRNRSLSWAGSRLGHALGDKNIEDPISREEHRARAYELTVGLHNVSINRHGWTWAQDQNEINLSRFLGYGIEIGIYGAEFVKSMQLTALSRLEIFQPRGHNRVDFDEQFDLLLRVLDSFLELQRKASSPLVVA